MTVKALLAINKDPKMIGTYSTLRSLLYSHWNKQKTALVLLEEVHEDKQLLSCLKALRYADYDLREEDLPSLKKLSKQHKVIKQIKKFSEDHYYQFKIEDLPIMEDLTSNPQIYQFIGELYSKGYTFKGGHYNALKNCFFFKDQILNAIEDPAVLSLFSSHIEIFEKIKPQNIEGFLRVAGLIETSASKEIQKLKIQLLQQLAESANPEFAWNQIEEVFLKNNLPLVGKTFRVFQILNNPAVFQEKIDESLDPDTQKGEMSPVLLTASMQERYKIIIRDLLKIHILSGNSSLIRYLETIKDGEQIFTKAEEGAGIASLSMSERIQLNSFLDKMETLYLSAIRGENRNSYRPNFAGKTPNDILRARMKILRRRMGVVAGRNQPFTETVHQLFLEPLGFRTIDEALVFARQEKAAADQRNREYAISSQIEISAGDLIKGVDLQYITQQMENGIVSNEHFGNDSDLTPMDIDTSRVMEADFTGETPQERFKSAVEASLAKGYGNVWLLIKNRGQFSETTPRQHSVPDPSRYELFPSKIMGEKHFGIRTGIPFSEVSAIIYDHKEDSEDQELAALKFQLAQNGYFIPIVNLEGKVIFTEADYESYKIPQQELQEVLQQTEFQPALLLDLLKRNPYLKVLLEGTAGVGEGWTVEEHTGMVLNQFEKYFGQRFSSPIINRGLFKLVLAMHDIGKSISVAKTQGTEAQHQYTKEVVERLFRAVGFNEKVSYLATNIVSQDILGEFIKSENPEKAASATAEAIRAQTEDIGIGGLTPIELLKILKIYYLCDASSYTEDASYESSSGVTYQGKPSLEKVFSFKSSGIGLSEENEKKIEMLLELLK